ncbi:LisH domain-containing protein armc9 [Blastocladiella emersonii ATCC 22665]|nr:LisH domain-containing protein armc9 [Blastocladiella emersonii ATCC 22665]
MPAPPPSLGFKPIAQGSPETLTRSPRLSTSSSISVPMSPGGAAGARARSPVRQSFDSGSSFDLFEHTAAIHLQPTERDDDPYTDSRRDLGFWGSLSIIVGMMIGSGIFVSPGPIFDYTGSAWTSLLIWVLAGVLSLTGALCYAELGTLISGNGGEYAYLLEAYGRFPALAFIWTSITLLKSGTAAILAATAAQYTCRLFDLVDNDKAPSGTDLIVERSIALVFLVAGIAINAFSPRVATRAQTTFLGIKLAAIALISLSGLFILVRGGGLGPLVSGGSNQSAAASESAAPAAADQSAGTTPASAHHSMLLALQAALWGFDGWNNLNYVTERVKEPERVVLRAIVSAVTLVTVSYVATNVAYLVVLPEQDLAANHGLVAEYGSLAFGAIGKIVLPLCIVASSFGALCSTLYTGSHLVTAAAQQSHLPSFFATLNAARGTPMRALALQLGLAIPMVASARLIELIHWYSFASYLFYGATALAVLLLRYVSVKWKYAERPFQVYAIVPVCFVAVCTWMVAVAVANEPYHAVLLLVWMCLGFSLWALSRFISRWNYLTVSEFNETLSAFSKEYAAKGNTFISIASGTATLNSADVRDALLKSFERGERGQFFNLWDSHLSDGTRSSEEAMRLEFYTSIHFAVFPVNAHVDQTASKLPLSSTLDTFKAFLETRGAQLSQTAEFLQYYALPFIPDPRMHPTFATIFSAEWLGDLRRKLTDFITAHLHVVVPSRLSEIVLSVEEYKARETRLLKKHQILQADYHNLLAITSEMIGTLASTLNGQRITQEYIAGVLERMQSFRKNVNQPARLGPKYLNFDLIKQALTNDISTSGRTKMVLLHALRLRAASQPTAPQRRIVVKGYIDYDLFGFHSAQPTLAPFSHAFPGVKEQVAKLVNYMCGFYCGRAYFSHFESHLLKAVLTALKMADRPSTQQHCLGILEKMSLRRSAQSYLITHGDVIRYLVVTLLQDDLDTVADGTFVYACALLMNLVLRTAGRRKAAEVMHPLLRVMATLLEHPDPVVRSYVHGVVYAVIEVPELADAARAMGIPDLLRCLRGNAIDGLGQQMDRILERLDADSEFYDDDDAQSEDGEEEDYEEELEEPDAGGDDVDPVAELGVGSDEALGDEFLKQYEAPDSRSQGRLVPARSQAARAQHAPAATATSVSLGRKSTVSENRSGSGYALGGMVGASPSSSISAIPGPRTQGAAAARPPSILGMASKPLPPVHQQQQQQPSSIGYDAQSVNSATAAEPRSRPRSIRVVAASQVPPPAGRASTTLQRDEHALPPPKLPKDGHQYNSQELGEYSSAFETRPQIARTPPAPLT